MDGLDESGLGPLLPERDPQELRRPAGIPPGPPSDELRKAVSWIVGTILDAPWTAALLAWGRVVILDILATHDDNRGPGAAKGRTFDQIVSDFWAAYGCEKYAFLREALHFAQLQGDIDRTVEAHRVMYSISPAGQGRISGIRHATSQELAAAREALLAELEARTGRSFSPDAFRIFTGAIDSIARHAVELGLVVSGAQCYVEVGKVDAGCIARAIEELRYFGEHSQVAEQLLKLAMDHREAFLAQHVNNRIKIQLAVGELTDVRIRQIESVQEVLARLPGRTAVLDTDVLVDEFLAWVRHEHRPSDAAMKCWIALGGQLVVTEEGLAEFDTAARAQLEDAINIVRSARRKGVEPKPPKRAQAFVRAFFEMQLQNGDLSDAPKHFFDQISWFIDRLPAWRIKAKPNVADADVKAARAALDLNRPSSSRRFRQRDAELLAFVKNLNGDAIDGDILPVAFLITRTQWVNESFQQAFGTEASVAVAPEDASALVSGFFSVKERRRPARPPNGEAWNHQHVGATGSPALPSNWSRTAGAGALVPHQPVSDRGELYQAADGLNHEHWQALELSNRPPAEDPPPCMPETPLLASDDEPESSEIYRPYSSVRVWAPLLVGLEAMVVSLFGPWSMSIRLTVGGTGLLIGILCAIEGRRRDFLLAWAVVAAICTWVAAVVALLVYAKSSP